MSLIAIVFVLRKSRICNRWNIPLLCSGTKGGAWRDFVDTNVDLIEQGVPKEQLEGMNPFPVEELGEPIQATPTATDPTQDIPTSTAAMAARLGGGMKP